MLLRGIGAAPGLAVAPCLIVQPLPEVTTVAQTIARELVEEELGRFTEAVQLAAGQLARETPRFSVTGSEVRRPRPREYSRVPGV